jgi:hypothetical protein
LRIGANTERNNGFLRVPSVNGRNNLNSLEVGFLETNSSFTDLFDVELIIKWLE